MSEEKNKNRSGNKIIDIQRSNKIRPITFTPEELEDPEVDEMIRESIRQEADRLEEELNNDPELMGVGASDDMFLSIVSRLKEQGVWEEEEPENEEPENESENKSEPELENKPENEFEIKEISEKKEDIYRMLPEEDLQALMLGREVTRQKEEKKRKRQRQRRTVRRIASVAAVFVVVCMVGMTSEANRRLVLKAWDAVMSVTGFKVVTNYLESENPIREDDEEERLAWKDAAERLGIPVLTLSYLPEGMIFEKYEVMEEMRMVSFLYFYKENVIDMKVIENIDANSIYYIKNEKAMLVDYVGMDKGIEAEIWQINSDSDMEIYMAEFIYNDYRYVMSGMISLEEIKKIIKNTIFL